VKITLACDRACPYCINKCRDYRLRWNRIISVEGSNWKAFRTIIISGGEPTTDMRLRDIARGLRIFTDGLVPIYLQTNGWGLTKALVKDLDESIDGIGLSIHDLDEFRHMLPRWEDIARIKPVRLYVQDTMYDKALAIADPHAKEQWFKWRVWTDGEFDPDEQIFLLKGWQTTPVLTGGKSEDD